MAAATTHRARTATKPARRRAAFVVAGWITLLALARLVGLAYVHAHDTPLAVNAVPWFGVWRVDPRETGALVRAAAVLALAVWLLPLVATRAAWRIVLVVAALSTAATTVVLAVAGPQSTRWTSIELAYGRYTGLVDAGGPAALLRGYIDRQPSLPGHLRSHPPGLLLALSGFQHLGLSGRGFQLVLMLAAGAVSSVAALIAFREVAGVAAARAAAPFVAVAPVLVWRTNPDVVFGAVALTGVTLVIVATGIEDRSRGALLAGGGGLVFAAGLMCSYGVALLALPVVAVVVHRRAGRALVWAAGGVALGLAVPLAYGFSWTAGLLQTRVQYRNSLATPRGYRYWLLGNAAVFATLIGPATVAGLLRMRDAAWKVLVLGGLACPIVAGLSGMSSAETERIWQPFVPLVLLAGAALWLRNGAFDVRAARRWLTVQALVAIAFQAALRSPW